MAGLKTSTKIRMIAKGRHSKGDYHLAARLNNLAYSVSLTESELASSKAQYNELASFVQSLQLDSCSDDINLELLLVKHKEGK